MKTKIYLLISGISLIFFHCIEEEQQIELNDSPVIKQKSSVQKTDSTTTVESIQSDNEADPPKDKDPYVKKL